MGDWWNPGTWDWGGIGRQAEGIAANTFAVPYAIGAGINALTGGKTTAWTPYQAFTNPALTSQTTYSDTTRSLSGYQGHTPTDNGSWSLPIVNPATVQVVHDVTNAVTKDLLGLDLNTLLLIAGGAFVFIEAEK